MGAEYSNVHTANLQFSVGNKQDIVNFLVSYRAHDLMWTSSINILDASGLILEFFGQFVVLIMAAQSVNKGKSFEMYILTHLVL